MSDVTIVKPHIESDKDLNYKIYGGYHTGVDVSASSVYNLCPGTAVLVSKDRNTWTVIVQYDMANCIQYKNLAECAVSTGEFVDTYQLIGRVDKFVHIDYLSVGENVWPVRVGSQTLYKHDPTEIVLNGYESVFNYLSTLQSPEPVFVTDDELPPTVAAMLLNNRDRGVPL